MRFIEDQELSPGRVLWNHLGQVDTSVSPQEQESLIGCEDVLTVEFENGALLDVRFYSRTSSGAVFVVAVVPRVGGSAREWSPAVERECQDWETLRSTILELKLVAETWKK